LSSQPWIGKSAPGFTLARVGGDELGLKDLRTKYVVVHFGASW
jgi:peroxiredoxin